MTQSTANTGLQSLCNDFVQRFAFTLGISIIVQPVASLALVQQTNKTDDKGRYFSSLSKLDKNGTYYDLLKQTFNTDKPFNLFKQGLRMRLPSIFISALSKSIYECYNIDNKFCLALTASMIETIKAFTRETELRFLLSNGKKYDNINLKRQDNIGLYSKNFKSNRNTMASLMMLRNSFFTASVFSVEPIISYLDRISNKQFNENDKQFYSTCLRISLAFFTTPLDRAIGILASGHKNTKALFKQICSSESKKSLLKKSFTGACARTSYLGVAMTTFLLANNIMNKNNSSLPGTNISGTIANKVSNTEQNQK